jgi:hypothetical protein
MAESPTLETREDGAPNPHPRKTRNPVDIDTAPLTSTVLSCDRAG